MAVLYRHQETVWVRAVVRGDVNDRSENANVRIQVVGGAEKILIVPVDQLMTPSEYGGV